MFKNEECFTCSLLAHIGEVFSFALISNFGIVKGFST
jgi:hypothetical protein